MSFLRAFVAVLLSSALAAPWPTAKRDPGQWARDTLYHEVCEVHHDDTIPRNKSIINWGVKAKTSPTRYLKPHPKPFGKDVAKWQKAFFDAASDASSGEDSDFDFDEHLSEPELEPLHKGAPTAITHFYPKPVAADDKDGQLKQENYMRSLKRLVDAGDQLVVYAPPEVASKIISWRSEADGLLVISDYANIWDFPNNKYQQKNFEQVQPALFAKFDGYMPSSLWRPQPWYNDPFLSAVYNAKAAVIWEAVLRNPFGSTQFAYVDAGLLGKPAPRDTRGREWGMVMDNGLLVKDKLAKGIDHIDDRGVLVAQYADAPAGLMSPCWSKPTRTWACKHFVASVMAGSAVRMLEMSVKLMKTVDDMDANGVYSGREEFVMSFVAARYPGTVFSIPETDIPKKYKLTTWTPMKVAFTSDGDPTATIDPVKDLFCKAG
ncbi:Uu.00g116050.m01.CDS01 [Anthostomella pinea]|uniref:Uu.00g116050.m01.CDS01 n=1 Tax=Anthostomella pinea TaxID=933095 RepID=A0AAI8VGN7_9PEZI|nr:Uu.00g116050.m01.CDS01 [Anthostomella pinea]